jgi:hypothetical protein
MNRPEKSPQKSPTPFRAMWKGLSMNNQPATSPVQSENNTAETHHKSIFDDKFFYLKKPVSVMQGQIVKDAVLKCNPGLDRQAVSRQGCPESGVEFSQFLRRLDPAESEIVSRVVFWTRKGMRCTHTNAQFGELIKRKHRQKTNRENQRKWRKCLVTT